MVEGKKYILKAETGYFKIRFPILKFIHKKVGVGIRKAFSIVKTGWEDSHDKKRHPEGVDRFMRIDRCKNLYVEKVIDSKTGNVVRDVEEALNKHFSEHDTIK